MAPCVRSQRPSLPPAASSSLLPLLIPTSAGALHPAASTPAAAAAGHGAHAAPLSGTGKTSSDVPDFFLEKITFWSQLVKLWRYYYATADETKIRKCGNIGNFLFCVVGRKKTTQIICLSVTVEIWFHNAKRKKSHSAKKLKANKFPFDGGTRFQWKGLVWLSGARSFGDHTVWLTPATFHIQRTWASSPWCCFLND